MTRPAVIGVRRSGPPAPATAPAAAAAPARTLEQAQALTVAVAFALVAARWLVAGVPAFEALLLVPFYFVFTPLAAWWFGLGVVYWSKGEREFVAIDASERPLLAAASLVVDIVASGFFAVAFFVVRLGSCGGG